MRVLLINAYNPESPAGIESYKVFRELVIKVFRTTSKLVENEYIERRLDNLAEFVLDWEHDNLDKKSQVHAKNFDKLDFVFLGGDMHTCPWEPVATQVVTIIHMCKQTKKPLFASGFGAFCGIYSLATKGSRFHILNGPFGEEIEHLASFPRYSIGNGAYPSGWLDNETGDIYTYNTSIKSWTPVCNIGAYRCASYGTPSSNRHAVKKYAREDHLLSYHQKVEALSTDEDVAHIRNPLLQHPVVYNMEAQNFTAKPVADWHLNNDGALPSGEGLYVIADGNKGPILLAKENMLLFAVKIERSNCFRNVVTIVTNFVRTQVARLTNSKQDILETSLSVFLFGRDGPGTGTYDSFIHRQIMTAALATKPVKSTLPHGPVKVDPPVISMFFQKPEVDKCLSQAIAAKLRKDSTAGMGQTVTVQNPLSARHGRLELLTARTGYNVNGSMTQVINTAISLSSRENPTELERFKPEEARELFTGRIMKDNNIATRRHHHSGSGNYNEVVYPAAHPHSGAAESNKDVTPINSVFDDHDVGLGAGSVHSGVNREGSFAGSGQAVDGEEYSDECDADILDRCFTYTPFIGKRLSVSQPNASSSSLHSSTSLTAAAALKAQRQVKTAAVDGGGSQYDYAANFPRPDTPPMEKPSQKTHRKHHLRDSKDHRTGRTKSIAGPRVPVITDWHKVAGTAVGSAGGIGANKSGGIFATQLPESAKHTSQSVRAPYSSNSNTRTHTGASQQQPPPLGQGPNCDSNFNKYVIQTARSARTAGTINTAMTDLHMHVHHPFIPTRMERRNSDEDGSQLGEFSSSSYIDHDHSSSLYSTSQYSSQLLPPKVVVVKAPKSGPYNSYKTISRKIQSTIREEANGKYEGQYTTEYVPESMRPIKDYNKAKEKFLAGPFKSFFGQANSAMVPGKDGLVRGQGPFPREPLPGMPAGITAADWAFLKHKEDTSNQLAGAWK